MMRFIQIAIITAGLALGLGIAVADEPHVKPVTDYVLANVKPWLSDPLVVAAINKQNVEYAKLKNYDINKLDNGWIDRSDKKLIASKMNNELSAFLRKKKESANGVIFEIFVFDNKGLNVGQTDLTQDFNQGDEAKILEDLSGRTRRDLRRQGGKGQRSKHLASQSHHQGSRNRQSHRRCHGRHRRGQAQVIIQAGPWMGRCIDAASCSLAPQVALHQVT